ncbi:MAG: peptidyl-prolyl cis-trans isomerase [Anaeromyxobacteraceae bacterium]
MRRLLAFGLCALAITACGGSGKKSGTGPVIAKGKGFTITADEFKARLDEQSPFMRARYNNLERKKEFLDNLVRFEVLAAEARRMKLDQDPDVQSTLQKIMVQKLVQTKFQDPKDGASPVADADAQKYYDEHKAEYQRPKRIRAAAVTFASDAGSAKRKADVAAAKKALAKLKVEEKKSPLAFNQLVTEFSEDAATKASGGDLGFKTQDELAAAFTPDVAAKVAALAAGQTTDVVETPKGVYILKLLGTQEELNRSFEQVKQQIVNKLAREKRTKEFDEFVKKLRDEAGISVDDKALDAVQVAAAPEGGMPPGMPGMPSGMAPHGAPPPAPAPAPAPVTK